MKRVNTQFVLDELPTASGGMSMKISYEHATRTVTVLQKTGTYKDAAGSYWPADNTVVFQQVMGSDLDVESYDNSVRLFANGQWNGGITFDTTIDNIAVANVPEPATLLLMSLGFGLFALKKKK